jgi:hypothetical protein
VATDNQELQKAAELRMHVKECIGTVSSQLKSHNL